MTTLFFICVAYEPAGIILVGTLQSEKKSVVYTSGQSGGIGRHEGLKIPWLFSCTSSSLVSGIHRKE